jgi:hypothetical protein
MVKKYHFFILFIIIFTTILISCSHPNGEEPVPHVMIDGVLYYTFSFDNVTSSPGEDEIVGIITSITSSNKLPTIHEQTNFSECLYQPYAFVDNELIIHISYTKNYGNTPWLIERWIKMDKCT